MALIAQYLFNGNSNDETGTYNGIPANVTYENAPVGYRFGPGVAVFNGTSSKIDLPNITTISGTSARTIEFWQYTNSGTTSSWKVTFGFGYASTNQFCGAWLCSGENRPKIDCYSVSVQYGNSPTPTTSWHHHMFVIPSNAKIEDCIYYFDGVQMEKTGTVSGTSSINTPNVNFAIGYRKANNGNFLSGKIGNLRIYDTALTADDALAHFKAERKAPTPIAQYLFNNNANDETGTYNGTPSNITYENAPTGYNFGTKVASFNGTSSKIELPQMPSISGKNAASYEFWLNMTTSNYQCWLSSGQRNAGQERVLMCGDSGYQYVTFGNNSFYETAAPQTNHWLHICYVVPDNAIPSDVKLYINGHLQPQTSTSGTTAFNADNTTISIGYRQSVNAGYITGKLGNFRIYNTTLLADDVMEHYIAERKSPTPIAQYLFNNNGNDETGTYNGTPSNITYENAPSNLYFGDKVAVFNGTSSKIDLPNITPIAGTHAKTYEFWQYTNSGSDAAWRVTVGGGNTSGTNKFCGTWLCSAESRVKLDTYGASVQFGTSPTPKDSWHHHVFVIPETGAVNECKYYLDGVEVPKSNAGSSLIVNPPDENYAIGYRRASNGNFISGKVGNLRIYNDILTPEEIMAHYLTESTAPVQDFNTAALLLMMV